MSRLPPLALDDIGPEARAALDGAEAMMGFMPNDGLIMARRPDILLAFGALVNAIYGPGEIEPGLKRLIGEAASKAAGCLYCVAHTAHGAAKLGVPAEKIAAVWEAETSPLFSPAERAAIRVAIRAALTPSAVEDEDLAELRTHYSDAAVVEIMAVVSLFGFLNRWNAGLDTTLEAMPAQVAARVGAVT